jgi:hypothetical protein
VVIKAAALTLPNDHLSISADSLTLITPAAAAESVSISNDRLLQLSAVSDNRHMVQLDATVASIFTGITWVAGLASDWAAQIFDGALNPWAVAVGGLLDVQLSPSTQNSDYELTVRGGLRSWTNDIRLIADDMDFLGGAGSVAAPGSLSLKAASSSWIYRLGTAAELGSGAPVAPEFARGKLDLSTRDLAALANGFSEITIGRTGSGNQMRLGDAFNMTTVKATGESRIVDAAIRDPLTLLTDALVVEGISEFLRIPLSSRLVPRPYFEAIFTRQTVQHRTPDSLRPQFSFAPGADSRSVAGFVELAVWIWQSLTVPTATVS